MQEDCGQPSTGHPAFHHRHKAHVLISLQLVYNHLFCGEISLYVKPPLGEDNGEDCMGAAAGLVHVCGGHSPDKDKMTYGLYVHSVATHVQP